MCGTIKKIADGVDDQVPPTIDDPLILDEIIRLIPSVWAILVVFGKELGPIIFLARSCMKRIAMESRLVIELPRISRPLPGIVCAIPRG